MSRLSDRRRRHDRFYRQAKAEGFAARAVYKLEDIDRKHGLLRPGQRVLDLGAAPGSWTQYAAGRVGARGRVVGVDLTAIDAALPPQAVTLQADVFDTPPEALCAAAGGRFHVVVSDMAPRTTGIRSADQARAEALFERALDLALEVLAPGGHFLGKVFQGSDFERLRRRMHERFAEVRVLKPPASRKESYEIYLLGLRMAAPPADAASPDAASSGASGEPA